jgi:hypothetical protein
LSSCRIGGFSRRAQLHEVRLKYSGYFKHIVSQQALCLGIGCPDTGTEENGYAEYNSKCASGSSNLQFVKKTSLFIDGS